MRLLIVSQWFPYPPYNGARQRVLHLLRGLGERHEVHFLSFTQSQEDVTRVGELVGICRDVALVPGREFQPTTANAVRALFSTKPRSGIDRWSQVMAHLVRDRIAAYSFDAAIAFTTLAGQYLVSCSLPKVLDDDNVDSAYYWRLVELADGSLSKFRRKLAWVKVARQERRLVAAFDATTAVSEEDRRKLARLVPSAQKRGALCVVPNGVDPALTEYGGAEVDPRVVISTGGLTYHANLDAAVFFCGRILPRIRERVPGVRFLITGRYDGVDVGPLSAAGATLTGFLDDIRPAVAGSAALVVPLRIGGGTRLKILEAMALGTPVVSTSLGAEGLGLKHRETALIADDPDEFARCTLDLMLDRSLRERIGANARRYVAERFDWRRSVEALDRVVRRVADRGEGVGGALHRHS